MRTLQPDPVQSIGPLRTQASGGEAKPRGVNVASHAAPDRFRLTASFIGLAVYLWVIHSYKAPIASYAIGLGLFGLLIQPFRLRLPLPLVFFGLFVMWTAVTVPMANNPALAWDGVVAFAKLWLIFLVACNVAHTRPQLHGVIIVWLGLFALYPVRGTFFNFMIGHQYFGRYGWNFIFQNPNDLAALTLPILAMSVAMLQGTTGKGWIRLSALAGVIVLPTLIFITQSRGGILALTTMALLILTQYRRQARGLALTVLVAGAVFLIAPPEVWNRLGGLIKAGDTETLREVDEEGSAEQRFEIWKVAGSIIADNPVTGVGLGGYGRAHAEYASSGPFLPTARGVRDTHSMYLNTLAETGGPGLLLFLAMIGAVLLHGRRVARVLAPVDMAGSRQVSTLLIGLIGFLQAGLFASLNGVAFLYIYLGIVVTAIAVLAPRAAAHVRSRVVSRPAVGDDGTRRAPLPAQ